MALDHVDFQLPGEVHGLLGENGAGKSTLMASPSVPTLRPRGRISTRVRRLCISSPLDAIKYNLRFDLPGAESRPGDGRGPQHVPGSGVSGCFAFFGVIKERKLYRLYTCTNLASYHMDLDPREQVENLSVTQQKMIEIAKALVAETSPCSCSICPSARAGPLGPQREFRHHPPLDKPSQRRSGSSTSPKTRKGTVGGHRNLP